MSINKTPVKIRYEIFFFQFKYLFCNLTFFMLQGFCVTCDPKLYQTMCDVGNNINDSCVSGEEKLRSY